MKNETKRQKDFSPLVRKLLLRAFGMVLLSLLILLVAYLFLWKERGGDLVVFLFEHLFGMTSQLALNQYQIIFRNNKELLLFGAAAVVFFILFYFSLRWFVRYFNKINRGIDALLEEEEKEIVLPPELAAVEKKLNTARQSLEKRALEARLAEQRKNDLVMYLAHDIKTPLTSVIGYLSLLDEATDMPIEQRAKYVHVTLAKAHRLEQLINEFFEITRYNLQTMVLARENIDLYYMLVQMVDELYPQLSAGGKEAVIHAPEDLTLYGDPDKLARVLNNILKNAVAYSPENSVIHITAGLSREGISLVFTNAGVIPQNELATIFDKFYRVDAARSSHTGGAGLGLAVAKEIVQLHGGHIVAASENGHTSFTVLLPQGEA